MRSVVSLASIECDQENGRLGQGAGTAAGTAAVLLASGVPGDSSRVVGFAPIPRECSRFYCCEVQYQRCCPGLCRSC
jgi:hypothetical protein